MIELGNVKQQNSVLENEHKSLKGEVKEYRFRETRLLTDYSELEEENVLLQKQVTSIGHKTKNMSSIRSGSGDLEKSNIRGKFCIMVTFLATRCLVSSVI